MTGHDRLQVVRDGAELRDVRVDGSLDRVAGDIE